MAKPDKIYLNNTNLIYAFDADMPDIGNLRETFFFNQLKTIGEITSSNRGDFISPTHAIEQLSRSGNMFVVKEQNGEKLFIVREQLRIFMATTLMQRIWRKIICGK